MPFTENEKELMAIEETGFIGQGEFGQSDERIKAVSQPCVTVLFDSPHSPQM